MKKDTIDQLFENHKGKFDVQNTSKGHQHRFLNKLNTQQTTVSKPTHYLKRVLAVAATLVVIVSISGLFFNTNVTAADLASVSPEMEQTQSFFTSTINNELKTLKGFNAPETKVLVQDALKQLEILEGKYELLKKDLVDSGNDKRVIYAMISNFQNRIELLEQVINKIEEVKNLNTQKNENTI